MERTIVNLRMPKELKEEAQKKAQLQGESLSVVVRQLLRDWIK